MSRSSLSSLDKVLQRVSTSVRARFSKASGRLSIALAGVKCGAKVSIWNPPVIRRFPGSRIVIEDNVSLCSSNFFTAIALNHPVTIRTLTETAKVKIGRNSGLSGTYIGCQTEIEIGEDCLIGANVTIIDTDFHPIAPIGRRFAPLSAAKSRPVRIGNNVFIGASAFIGKGVTIGDNSVIAAGSVVSCDVPANTVFGGNPARKIKDL